MATSSRQDRARMKLLRLLNRNELEELSGLERPWLANKPDLINNAFSRWDKDEIERIVMRIVNHAN